MLWSGCRFGGGELFKVDDDRWPRLLLRGMVQSCEHLLSQSFERLLMVFKIAHIFQSFCLGWK